MNKKQRKAKKQKARDNAARVKAWRAYRAKSCGGRIFQQFIPALYEYVPAEPVVMSGLNSDRLVGLLMRALSGGRVLEGLEVTSE